MTQFLYTIRDGKADSYSPPFLARTDGEAMRFVMGTLSGDSQLAVFPDDFTLFRVGEWFEESAVIESMLPQFVAHVSSLVPGGTLNRARWPTDPQTDEVLNNGEAHAFDDGASVQPGTGSDDSAERV